MPITTYNAWWTHQYHQVISPLNLFEFAVYCNNFIMLGKQVACIILEEVFFKLKQNNGRTSPAELSAGARLVRSNTPETLLALFDKLCLIQTAQELYSHLGTEWFRTEIEMIFGEAEAVSANCYSWHCDYLQHCRTRQKNNDGNPYDAYYERLKHDITEDIKVVSRDTADLHSTESADSSSDAWILISDMLKDFSRRHPVDTNNVKDRKRLKDPKG